MGRVGVGVGAGVGEVVDFEQLEKPGSRRQMVLSR